MSKRQFLQPIGPMTWAEFAARADVIFSPGTMSDAPRSVRIYREEIWLAVKRENEAAAGAAGADMPAALRTAVADLRRTAVSDPGTSPAPGINPATPRS